MSNRGTSGRWFWLVSFLVVLLVITCSITVSGQLVCVIIYQQRHSLRVLQTEARLWSLNRFFFWKPEEVACWHTLAHWHKHTHTEVTHRRQRTVSKRGGFFFRAASSQPSEHLSAVAAVDQQGATVIGTGSPGRCLAPPPVRPLWRPSWRGRSRWWRVRQPFSRSCSVRDGRGKTQRLSFWLWGIQSISVGLHTESYLSLAHLDILRNNWLLRITPKTSYQWTVFGKKVIFWSLRASVPTK